VRQNKSGALKYRPQIATENIDIDNINRKLSCKSIHHRDKMSTDTSIYEYFSTTLLILFRLNELPRRVFARSDFVCDLK